MLPIFIASNGARKSTVSSHSRATATNARNTNELADWAVIAKSILDSSSPLIETACLAIHIIT